MAGVIFSDNDSAKTVMDYQPKKISSGVTKQAQSFVVAQPTAPEKSFRISDLVAQQTGIHEIEKASIEKRVEQKALEKLKEIQESAYQEAYNLGLEEGVAKGYEEAREIVAQRLQTLNVLLEKLSRIKSEVLQRNEIQMIDIIYMMASKVANFEIQKNPERILPVLRKAMESLQKDESMIIKISMNDLEIIEELKKVSKKEFDFLMSPRIEGNETITPGGCIIETNYGLIDATIEERIEKLWQTLEEIKPSAKKDQFE